MKKALTFSVSLNCVIHKEMKDGSVQTAEPNSPLPINSAQTEGIGLAV